MGGPTTDDEHKTGASVDVPATPSQTFCLLGHPLQPPLPTSPPAGCVLSPGDPVLLSRIAASGPQCTQAPRGETSAAPLGPLCRPPLSGLSQRTEPTSRGPHSFPSDGGLWGLEKQYNNPFFMSWSSFNWIVILSPVSKDTQYHIVYTMVTLDPVIIWIFFFKIKNFLLGVVKSWCILFYDL